MCSGCSSTRALPVPPSGTPIVHSARPIGACVCLFHVRCICTERGPFTECPAVLAIPSLLPLHCRRLSPKNQPAQRDAPLPPEASLARRGKMNGSPPFPSARSNEKTPPTHSALDCCQRQVVPGSIDEHDRLLLCMYALPCSLEPRRLVHGGHHHGIIARAIAPCFSFFPPLVALLDVCLELRSQSYS